MTRKYIITIATCLAVALPTSKVNAQCKEFKIAELEKMLSYTHSEIEDVFTKNGYKLLNPNDENSLMFDCFKNSEAKPFLIHLKKYVHLMNRSKSYTDNIINSLVLNGYKVVSADGKMPTYANNDFIVTIPDEENNLYGVMLIKQNNVPAKRLDANRLEIDSYTNYSDVSVKKGDKVYIRASGIVKTGAFSGSTGPLGQRWINTWNIEPNINYGALLVGVKFAGAMQATGEESIFTANASGILVFRINDTDPSDNVGGFIVEYSINKPLPTPSNH